MVSNNGGYLLNKCKTSFTLSSFLSALQLEFSNSPPVWAGRALICRSIVFGVCVGEAEEVILVQVHDDQLVGRSQVHWHLGKLLVKVTSVTTAPLQVWRVMKVGETG